jgi:hypothetical protein
MRAFNLIPDDERGGVGVGAGKSGGSAFIVLGLLGVLAIFALLYGQASRQISSQTGKISTLDAQAQAAQAQAAKLAPYVSFKTLHEQRVQAVDQLVASRFDWPHAFHELGRVLPQGQVALTSLTGTIGSSSGSGSAGADTAAGAGSKAAAATGAAAPAAAGSSAASSSSVASATPAGSVPTFTLAGCAASQSMVALTLDRLRLIDGVSEVTLQSSTQASKSGSGSGGAGCAGATFAMQITFDPLPSASATSSSSATPTTATSALTPTTGTPTTSTGAAR